VVEDTGRRTRRALGVTLLTGGLVVGVTAGLLIGRTLADQSDEGRSSSDATHAPRTLTDGPLEFEALGARCGLIAVQGDHADWLAEGRYCRVRLAVTNMDRHVHSHDATRLHVVDAAGAAYEANLNATQIADQPTVIDLKVGNRLEFDAWFDVPENARIVALGVVGEDRQLDLGRFEPHASPPAQAHSSPR